MNNKFKSIGAKIKAIYGDVYKTYPVTMIVADITMVACLLFAYLGEKLYDESQHAVFRFSEWLFVFGLYFLIGCFCMEAFPKSFFEKNGRIRKIVGMVIFAVLSIFFSAYVTDSFLGVADVSKITRSLHGSSLLAWNMAYWVIITLIIFYCRYKQSGYTMEKYLVSVFVGGIQIGIVWGVLALGFLLLGFAFEELIGEICGLYSIPQILIIGLYVIPCVIMCLTKVKEEVGRFFEALIKYVSLIITVVGAFIIYLYMIKLLITGIPSNEIFVITSVLFFVAIPVGYACTAFERDTFLQKIAYILPYIYAPFILLQAYSIIVRIREYGITPSRYLGVVLIVLEIVYIVVYAVGRKHIDKIIIVMMALTVIVTLIPGVNVNALSKISQKRIINQYLTKGMPETEEGRRRLSGAYDFLLGEYGEEYIDSMLNSTEQEEIKSIDDSVGKNTLKNYGLYSDSLFFDTDGYEMASEFKTILYSYDDDKDLTQMTMLIDNIEFGPFDLTKEYESVKQRCIDRNDSRTDGVDIVKINDDCELVITRVNITEDTSDNRIVEFIVRGYILMNRNYYETYR